jgi:hypothetical protein
MRFLRGIAGYNMADHNCSGDIRENFGITTGTIKKKYLKRLLEHLERIVEPGINISQRAEDGIVLILVTGS